MKTEGAIRHKIKQARYRHLKRLIEEGLAKSPENCTHNRPFHAPAAAAAQQPPVGICVCPGQVGDLLCDPAWGGVDRARSCTLFQSATTKEQIKAEFVEFLSTNELPAIAREYPDLAALLWVLEGGDEVHPDTPASDAPQDPIEISERVTPGHHVAEVVVEVREARQVPAITLGHVAEMTVEVREAPQVPSEPEVAQPPFVPVKAVASEPQLPAVQSPATPAKASWWQTLFGRWL